MKIRRRQFYAAVTALVASCSVAVPGFAQSRDINVTSSDQVWEGAVPGAKAGSWLDLGAVSIGDDRRDLVIGAPGGAGIRGTVHIIYGGPVRSGTINLSNSDALITGEANGDLFGTSTAVGNILSLEGANPKNLVVGAPNALSGRGAVYLFAGPFDSNASVSAAGAVFKVIGAPGDQLGAMLATADLDNDGHREIVIGAPGQQRVYVIKGLASMTGTQDLAVTPAARTYTFPFSGSVLTAGDVDGDNIQDLLIGAPSQNIVYFIKGQNGAIPTAAAAGFVGLNTGDQMGASIRLADIDADGKRDILIGAPGGDGPDNTRTDAGEVYLIWGGQAMTSRNMLAADAVFYGHAGERLGAQLTQGDINRDIWNDVVMLADGAAEGNGIFYIYYGRARNLLGTASASGQRVIDFTAPGQVDRRIGSGPTLGAMKSAQVFEVTGEGARDIIVGLPGTDGTDSRVFFTLSPKMTLPSNSLTTLVRAGTSRAVPFSVLNSAQLPITFTVTTATPWISVTPTSGSAIDGAPGNMQFTLSSANRAPGTYSGQVTITSTSPDLEMFLNVPVTMIVTNTILSLDGPANNSTVSQPFNVGGWALDQSSTNGPGVDALHVWAFPLAGGSGIFLGATFTGGPRPDVGAVFGSQFNTSGFNMQVTGLPVGDYVINVYARNTRWQEFDQLKQVLVHVASSARMSIDTPGNGATVNSGFNIAGWAFDGAASTGTGVDAIHVWAIPANGTANRFLGVAGYGTSRPDVGAAFGSRFTPSGFTLNTAALPAGTYTIAVYAHSSVSGSFDNMRAITVTVR
jgi:hypothetical protein